MALTLLLAAGCKQKDAEFEVLSLSGTIEKIEPNTQDQDTGRIAVRYRTEKRPDEQVGHGQITRETEIIINGALAKLGDLKTGETIRAEVRVQKGAEGQTPFVLRIRVDRAATDAGGS